MSASPSSNPSWTGSTEETPADLSQNLDEVADLQLGLGAIGGLRHSAACDAAERSKRRYDDRQHRLHEARMKRLGLEGEETLEDDMAQQVLIRSPVTNHYHYAEPPSLPASSPPRADGSATPKSTVSTLAKAALIAAGLLGAGGIGAAIPWMSGDRDMLAPAPPTQTSVTGPWVETETWDYLPGETPE